jgi:LuxR family transcriptional regulator, maltose regulon positive regulatory protein
VDTPLLTTKLYVPHARTGLVSRQRLVEKLNAGMSCRLTLVSAPAGFGKTTLVSEWVHGCKRPVAWLSLDKGDNEPTSFVTYLIAALQTVAPKMEHSILDIFQMQQSQTPPIESLLTTFLNDLNSIPEELILVLDDYHVIEAPPLNQALSFLIEHLPPQLHLVVATREDPPIPLARLRVRGQLTELRAADLRFTPVEAAEFLNQVMGLKLSGEDVAALENRTEGWIAGLQLAALSMQGNKDTTSFIKSFTGSHRFVLDYLVEEVLQKQPARIQNFLLRTSILDRLCGPLCDAVLLDRSISGQETLEYLDHANLFVVPLDNERHWYRYHHLFAELLNQRLRLDIASSPEVEGNGFAELHQRASQWYEDNHLAFEAFRHAIAANDVERAERLIESREMDLHFRSVTTVVLDWLESLPEAVLDAHPQLWVRSAGLALMVGQTSRTEGRLQAAERALQNIELDAKTRDLIGRIASIRATLALTRYQPEAMITQSLRALQYLHPENLTSRFTANWALGTALMYQGDRAGATRARQEGMALSQKSGNVFSIILATAALGKMQELDNQLYQAAETYHRSLQLSGDYPQPSTGEVHLGLAHIYYEWNDLEVAEQHGQHALQLTRQWDRVIDRFIVSEVFLASLKLARGDVDGAATLLAEAEQSARQQKFLPRLPEIAAVQVPVLIRQGQVAVAAKLASQYELPLSLARVLITQGDPSAALAVLEPFRRQMEARGWADERLKAMVLQAVALHAHSEEAQALQVLDDVLALAHPGGFIRIFVDEGTPMGQLLSAATPHGVMPDYVNKLLTMLEAEKRKIENNPCLSTNQSAQSLIEAISLRELEILRLIARGLSNREISERLFLALSTVKGHNRNIFDKLQVQSRTEAIVRARELGLL